MIADYLSLQQLQVRIISLILEKESSFQMIPKLFLSSGWKEYLNVWLLLAWIWVSCRNCPSAWQGIRLLQYHVNTKSCEMVSLESVLWFTCEVMIHKNVKELPSLELEWLLFYPFSSFYWKNKILYKLTNSKLSISVWKLASL